MIAVVFINWGDMSFSSGICGIAAIGGDTVYCTTANVVWQQNILFYDHTIGLLDTMPSGIFQKGKGGGPQSQQRLLRPSPRVIGGGLSFIVDTDSGAAFSSARDGEFVGVKIKYNNNDSYTFSGCVINNYNFSVSAGDIAQVSLEVMGDGHSGGQSSLSVGLCFKDNPNIVTWSDVMVSGTYGDIQSINFSINNNCLPIYVSKPSVTLTSDLDPLEIRVGMQNVTGSISFYGVDTSKLYVNNGITTLSLDVGAFSTDLNIMFDPAQNVGQPAALVSSINFVGVDRPFG